MSDGYSVVFRPDDSEADKTRKHLLYELRNLAEAVDRSQEASISNFWALRYQIGVIIAKVLEHEED